jgi:hypothetical protein
MMALHTVSVTATPRRVRQDRPARNNPALALFLADGGDERIKPDPLTGRTKYWTPASPAPDEIWFSSSTASAIDRRGFAAANEALAALTGEAQFLDPTAWFDRLRQRLVALFGIPGSEAVFCASGTEAEFIALSIVLARAERPLTSIVVAPTETGSGVMQAAGGRHFLASSSLAGAVEKSAHLQDLDARDVQVEAIAIRDPSGKPRDSGEIDAEAANCVTRALAAGRDVILHVLDTSKTGLAGVTRQAARALAKQADGRVCVVVDACQLRCPAQRVQGDLEAGFMVMITGSKFAGGPPYAGALLLPPGLAESLRGSVPAGLAAYSARYDWPAKLRRNFTSALEAPFNLGLGLRWEAALATIEPFFALPESIRAHICVWFAAAVQRQIAARPHLRMTAPYPDATIFPVVTDGATSQEGAAMLYAALATAVAGMPAELGRSCHVGQPVAVGGAWALRICASMPLVLDIAAHMAEGRTIESAPVGGDLDILFRKWDRLADR